MLRGETERDRGGRHTPDYGLLQSKSDAEWLFAQKRLAGER
jgi:hypothetical protein